MSVKSVHGRELTWFPSKAFGQNYLINEGVIRKIVDIVSDHPGHVVEIGPGPGALTQELLARGFSVTGIELHRETAAALREKFAGEARFALVEADAAETDFYTLLRSPNDVVLGNLPYCVASRILFQLFRTGRSAARWVLMFQREVAMRITASPKSRDYGQLSIVSQLASSPSMVFHVSPGSFFPAPEVVSTVVAFRPFAEADLPWDDFSAWLTRVFSLRRKQMGRILATLAPGIDAARLAAACGFDLKQRPEELPAPVHWRLFCEVFP